jgi:hypothetical protein
MTKDEKGLGNKQDEQLREKSNAYSLHKGW